MLNNLDSNLENGKISSIPMVEANDEEVEIDLLKVALDEDCYFTVIADAKADTAE